MPGGPELPTRVVYFHSVSPLVEGPDGPGDSGGMITPPDVLEAHVEMLRDLGYRFATAGRLARECRDREPPPGILVLTFDDGWRDGLTTVAPLLNRLAVPATFFVGPGALGGPQGRLPHAGRLMDEDEVRSLHAAGMEIGSHSLTHRNLFELDDAELRHEFEDSRQAIEAITGEPCVTVSYPSGRCDARIERMAAESGYQLGFVADTTGPWRRYAVPRVHGPTSSAERLLDRLMLPVTTSP